MKTPHDLLVWMDEKRKRRCRQDCGYIIVILFILLGLGAAMQKCHAEALYDIQMPEPVEVPTC